MAGHRMRGNNAVIDHQGETSLTLPKALEGWRQWLEWFAPDQIHTIAELVQQLHRLMGSVNAYHQGQEPEPDGLGDLHRNGLYERLLSSEWLLADELPDEFLRRAVSSEHLFLAPAYREHQATRYIVALFDAGVLQLGAPRLVHLAMAILLDRRAREAGSIFLWGALQGKTELRELNTASDLKLLLNDRCYDVMNKSHEQDWCQFFIENPMEIGELWGVGDRKSLIKSASLNFTHRTYTTRHLRDKILNVTMIDGAGECQLALPIPSQKLAKELLSGQFDVPLQSLTTNVYDQERISLLYAPFLSVNGRSIAMVLLDKSGLVIVRFPKKKNMAPSISVQNWGKSERPASFFSSGRNIASILNSGEHLRFWKAANPGYIKSMIPAERVGLLSSVCFKYNEEELLYTLLPNNHLVQWTRSALGQDTKSNLKVISENIIGICRVRLNCLIYVQYVHNKIQLYKLNITEEPLQVKQYILGESTQSIQKMTVLFAGIPQWGDGECVVAIGEHSHWDVYTPVGPTSGALPFDKTIVKLPSGWVALGILYDVPKNKASFLMLDQHKKTVALFEDEKINIIYRLNDHVTRETFCPDNGILTLLTEKKELIVYSVFEQSICFQVRFQQRLGK